MPVCDTPFYVIDERTGRLWAVPASSVLWQHEPMSVPWQSWKRHVVDSIVDRNAFVTAEMLIALGHDIDSAVLQTSPRAVVATMSGRVVYVHSFKLDITTSELPEDSSLRRWIGTESPGATFLWPCAYSHSERVYYKLKQVSHPLGYQHSFVQLARQVLELGELLERPNHSEWGARTLRPSPSFLLGAHPVTDTASLTAAERFAWLHAPVAPFLFRENRAQCEQSHRAAIEEKVKDPVRTAYSAQCTDQQILREARLENSLTQRIYGSPSTVQRMHIAVRSGIKTMKMVGQRCDGLRHRSHFPFVNLPVELQSLIVAFATEDAFRMAEVSAAAGTICALRMVNVSFKTFVDRCASYNLNDAATSLYNFIDSGVATPEIENAVFNGRISTFTYTRFSCSAYTLWYATFYHSPTVPIVQRYLYERQRVESTARARSEQSPPVPNQHVAVIEARARRPVERTLPSRVRAVMQMAECASAAS